MNDDKKKHLYKVLSEIPEPLVGPNLGPSYTIPDTHRIMIIYRKLELKPENRDF